MKIKSYQSTREDNTKYKPLFKDNLRSNETRTLMSHKGKDL